MLTITEFLDIKEIEKLRAASGATLDGQDNFSWHIALKDSGKVLGTARLYKLSDGDLFIDRPYLYSHTDEHWEMLTRTLLLKAQAIGGFAVVSGLPKLYEKYGFKADGERMRMLAADIKFPKSCGGKDDGHSDCKQCKG